MNILYTNTDPVIAANEHCNVHQVTMIREYAQLLSTAHHIFKTATDDMYKIISNPNHPSARWVREGSENYLWVFTSLARLHELYMLRSKNKHLRFNMLQSLQILPKGIPLGKTPILKVTKNFEYIKDPCKAYQAYLNNKFYEWIYRTDKRNIPVNFTLKKPAWCKYYTGEGNIKDISYTQSMLNQIQSEVEREYAKELLTKEGRLPKG